MRVRAPALTHVCECGHLSAAYMHTPDPLAAHWQACCIPWPLLSPPPRNCSPSPPRRAPSSCPQISPEVDDDPRCAFFRQARNGLYIRMALLKMCILGE